MTTPTSPDLAAVAEFMTAFGQTVRSTPTTQIADAERLLRVRLVIEEALEFAEAMGCSLHNGHGPVVRSNTVVSVGARRRVDLVEAADALADLTVVTKGSALTLGIPLDEVFAAVHATNMAKMGPDGEPVRDDHGKVCKPAGWVGPTAAIAQILHTHGWDGS